ncbi:hypothetical protein KGP17_12740 [Serratia sp. JSRIV001]|uniref:hypothetical protein n=1 Tax=Serratia sp. JSRIV001 TaxID=2831893 RepID=UPI000562EF42|nr:hypothetical protein [Serratia sp. JSRIV001]UAN48327.1 hypothetical protein KGP17_12740 [Serratia sp. JSRIV001]
MLELIKMIIKLSIVIKDHNFKKEECNMNENVSFEIWLSAMVEYYSDLWSTILFWSGIILSVILEVSGQSTDIGGSLIKVSLGILAIRLINHKMVSGKWSGW